MTINPLPLLGISMGDPGGIGPEICVKALNDPEIYRICRPLVVGDVEIISNAVRFCDLNLSVQECKIPEQSSYTHSTIDILSLGKMSMDALKHKQVTAAQGEGSFAYVEKAIELAMANIIDGSGRG